jgi:hypothetical protein
MPLAAGAGTMAGEYEVLFMPGRMGLSFLNGVAGPSLPAPSRLFPTPSTSCPCHSMPFHAIPCHGVIAKPDVTTRLTAGTIDPLAWIGSGF